MKEIVFIREVEPRITKRKNGRKQTTKRGLYKCHCGKEFISFINNIPKVKGCGCGQPFRHGYGKCSENLTWLSMKNRCYDKNASGYNHYGGRGITVCDRWLEHEGFKNFIEDMGMKPTAKHSLDRINVNNAYCKENCRWATQEEQSNNRRNNIVLTYNNDSKNLLEWSKIVGISTELLRARYKHGWSIKDILTIPKNGKRIEEIDYKIVEELRILRSLPKLKTQRELLYKYLKKEFE